MEWAARLYDEFFGTAQAVAPLYLLGFVTIAFVLYHWRRETGGFLAYVFPKSIWFHKSSRLDLSLFAIGRLMSFFGLLARFTAAPVVAGWVGQLIPQPLYEDAALSPVLLAVIVFVFGDFALYWIHRAHHNIKVIWPLHAVHHSAEVLTPITAYRQHPFGHLVSATMYSFIFGGLFGVTVGALGPDLSYAEIAGANAFVLLANITLTNFQHSHIWISFGPVFERIFISPAQHQVHHSVAPKHFNKNYGQTLALWDWLFGTLYLIREKESLVLGLDGKADAPLATHRLDLAIVDPLKRMLRPRD